jgi:hypothetical protein
VTLAARRVYGGASAALLLWAAAQATHAVLFCQPHHAWIAARAGRPEPVLERGERTARLGDSVLVCETTHRTGPIAWHQDLDCFCAPADMTPSVVAARVGGACTLDHFAPSRTDASGACRFARCNHYVDAE